jgi:hypothetical protein
MLAQEAGQMERSPESRVRPDAAAASAALDARYRSTAILFFSGPLEQLLKRAKLKGQLVRLCWIRRT